MLCICTRFTVSADNVKIVRSRDAQSNSKSKINQDHRSLRFQVFQCNLLHNLHPVLSQRFAVTRHGRRLGDLSRKTVRDVNNNNNKEKDTSKAFFKHFNLTADFFLSTMARLKDPKNQKRFSSTRYLGCPCDQWKVFI